ncbi:MAG TPA: YdeI/OmpD-associated family protein [Candidatus Acidoferrales bacterium]|nr:YdeI/OmpD-associated family protein [Candidatus Acidoferrales bacterium]
MPGVDDAPHVTAEDAASWRAWLEANHGTVGGAWLVTWRAGSGHPMLDYESAVEEAICFGWVDSRTARVDHERTKLYFAPRQSRSAWSASNKARVERLTAAGRMAPAGLAAVQRARANGTWQHLDAVERLDIPADLQAALAAQPRAAEHFSAFPPSTRRAILEWIAAARRPATRAARITETATLADRNERANQGRPKA